mmetsp:Transcript_10657/g.12453  ORF Transcript_10657/g.12453 Transcript_10657/m.12453 type:complete len:96 (+) Transcript_10657:226-513(+)
MGLLSKKGSLEEQMKWEKLAYETKHNYKTSTSVHGSFFQPKNEARVSDTKPIANRHAEDWHHHQPNSTKDHAIAGVVSSECTRNKVATWHHGNPY